MNTDLIQSDMPKSSRLESDDGDGVQMFAAPLHSEGQFCMRIRTKHLEFMAQKKPSQVNHFLS